MLLLLSFQVCHDVYFVCAFFYKMLCGKFKLICVAL